MKRIYLLTIAATLLLANTFAKSSEKPNKPKYKLKEPSGYPIEFRESWGYVTQSRMEEYNQNIPLTDVCFFAADFDCYGDLISVPPRSKLKLPEGARSHLVVICDSKSLTHFVINPDLPVKDRAIKQIVEAAKNFDGLQLDFELIPAKDGPAYLKFVTDLKTALEKRYGKNNKMYTICVPARMKLLTDDLFPYATLSKIFDRIFVMTYDEHWSTSKPGPIASLDWCRKCAEYAVQTVPSDKLIMGVPFYGRTWTSETTSGAWYFSGVNRIMTENGVKEVTYVDGIPTFNYTQEVNVTGYFNDTSSVLALCRLYATMNVQNIGFWRIGQEDPDFWEWLILK